MLLRDVFKALLRFRDLVDVPSYTGAALRLLRVKSTEDGIEYLTPGNVVTLNAGTGAGNLVQLNGSGQLPAVDARNLTNLDAGDITQGLGGQAGKYLQVNSNANGITFSEVQSGGGADTIGGMIEAASNRIYYLGDQFTYSCTITSFSILSDSGTCTVSLRVNGTSIQLNGSSTLSVSSSRATPTVGANQINVGDVLTLAVTNNSFAIGVRFSIGVEK